MTKTDAGSKAGLSVGPVVGSSHLADGRKPSLSEVELALSMCGNGFHRWMTRCMNAAGGGELGPLDVLVLHSINHRERPKKLADLCLILNIEDTHTVNYAIKKLQALGLVESTRQGKEKVVAITNEGQALCQRYKEVREALLFEAVDAVGLGEEDLSRVAALLRSLSGQYDQAARAAASL
ncbi:MAG: winged helix DNA-binding protein [Cohaesibacter sp.]|nr:winged helix DNA-binding protein [Cohaesibacter sp.]MCV6601855.1 winged helix DNA-binding protein [Cohaesibacter sp.]